MLWSLVQFPEMLKQTEPNFSNSSQGFFFDVTQTDFSNATKDVLLTSIDTHKNKYTHTKMRSFNNQKPHESLVSAEQFPTPKVMAHPSINLHAQGLAQDFTEEAT